MKILIAHNYYQQRGGEASVFEAECTLLENNGHQIIPYTKDNHQINDVPNKFSLFLNTYWSTQSYKELKKIIEKEKPDIAHFHNAFPLISPSAYYACQEMGVSVVQTLHNYRMICPSALLLRENKICELCVNKFFAWPGIIHKCYRNSAAQSAVVASLYSAHRLLQTWNKQVDSYIVLTETGKKKLTVNTNLEDKVKVKPNFIEDPDQRQNYSDYIIFIGRLSSEKGIDILLEAMQALPHIKLKLVGDGPLLKNIQNIIQKNTIDNVEICGRLPHTEVLKLLKGARFLAFPSISYEGFPLVLVEAMACGVPSIVSNIGSMKEIIQDNHTGLHFEVGNDEDLNEKISKLYFDQNLIDRMGNNARLEYEQKYTPETNYKQLMDIYDFAIQNKKHKPGA